MRKKTLATTNTYLRNGKSESSRKMRIRSLASSTAIETEEAIETIEARLKDKRLDQHRATLA